jgi:20S proteasome alpha/beta subunit
MDKIYPIQQQQQRRHSTIVAAAAGDNADVNRMIQMLTSQATVQEYESCIGHDVEYISIRKESEDLLQESTSGLSVEAVARLARSQIAASLRSQTPYQVCMLVAGMQPCHHDDEKEEDDRIEACFSSHLQQQIQRASRDFHHNDVVVGGVGGSRKADESRTDTSTVTKDTTFVTDTTTSLPILLKPQLYWLDNYGALQKLPFGAHGLGANFLLSILDQGYSRDMSREDALSLIRECFRQLKLRFVMNSPQLPCIKCIDQHGCHVIQPAIANI